MRHEDKVESMKKMHKKLLQNIEHGEQIKISAKKREKLESAHEKIKDYYFVLQKKRAN
ncbi:MAG: hypothetical protein QXN59_02495 [Candidatus Micrarchaeaceae archaeon]